MLCLGMQYLWFDRYYHPDEAEWEQQQICNMNMGYHAVELTTIAAAGEGCYCGLPGV